MPVIADVALPTTFEWDELGEEHGLEEGVNESGPWARKPYRVPWLNRREFVQALFGQGQSTGPGGAWIRPTRFRYPDPSFADNIFAKGVSIKALGDIVGGGPAGLGAGLIEYTDALVTVEFGMLDWVGTDPLNSLGETPQEQQALLNATQELDFTAEAVVVPAKVVTFTDGTKYDVPMHRIISVIKETLTWHRLPYLPVSQIQQYAGCVNDDVFLGNARGTCFFEGAKTTRELDSEGNVTQKVAVSFKWRTIDWNKFMRPDTGAWDVLIYNGNPTDTTYQYRPFAPLLY